MKDALANLSIALVLELGIVVVGGSLLPSAAPSSLESPSPVASHAGPPEEGDEAERTCSLPEDRPAPLTARRGCTESSNAFSVDLWGPPDPEPVTGSL